MQRSWNNFKENIVTISFGLRTSDRVMLLKIEGKPFNLVIIQAYAPTQDHGNEIVEEFYSQINQCMKHVSTSDVLLRMGDWNAKVGFIPSEYVLGSYGLGEKNE